jgi:hypothetical protein
MHGSMPLKQIDVPLRAQEAAGYVGVSQCTNCGGVFLSLPLSCILPRKQTSSSRRFGKFREVDRDSNPLAAVQQRKRQIHVPMFLLDAGGNVSRDNHVR